MGYAGSADIFQAEMMDLMEAIEYVRAYIDNLLVITRGYLDLAGNVADMSRHVSDDTMCRSNFGQMGPCRRHKI